METKILVAVFALAFATTPTYAQDKLGLIKDDAAIDAATKDLGTPDATVEYQVVDENGQTKTSGTAEVTQDPKKPGEVVVVVKNPDGTITEVRRDKKVMTPTQWGEGVAWYDIGYGMVAGKIGESALQVPSENGPVPVGNLYGRNTQYHSQANGGWSLSAVVRPKIAQQRITLGFDINPTGCDGSMGYLAKDDVDMHSGLKCNVVFSKYAEFAFYRKGSEGKISEFAVGIADLGFKVDHTVGVGTKAITGEQATEVVTQSKQRLYAPKFSYRFWTNSMAHPQLDITAGKGVFIVNFFVRFSPKKKVKEVANKADPF